MMLDASACTFESTGLTDPTPLIFSVLIGSLLYGVFMTLFVMSLYTLLRKGLKSTSSKVVFTMIITMYTVSTLHWIGISLFAWQELRSTTPPSRLAGFMVISMNFLPAVNHFLGETIVIWRAWLVWNQSILALLGPALLFVGALAAAMVYVVTLAWNVQHNSVAVLCAVGDDLQSGGLPIAYTLAVATNVYATSLVAVKAWKHRRSIRQHLNDGNRRTYVEKILTLLVESGSLYCVVLVIAAACFWSGNLLAAVFMSPILPQITASKLSLTLPIAVVTRSTAYQGIYPTIIIVLASLQKTHCDRQFTYETPVAFASPPQASRDAVTFDLASAMSTSRPRRPSASDHLQMSAEDVVLDVSREWKAEQSDSIEPIAGVDVSRELHNA